MIIIISKIIFIASALGILFIIFRKIPTLSQLSEEPLAKRFSFKETFAQVRVVKENIVLSNFFQNTILRNLEKTLRKFKILALKIDNISDKFLRKLKGNHKK